MVFNVLPSPILLPITILSLLIIPTSTHSHNTTTSSGYEFCSLFKCGNITFPFPFSSLLTFGLAAQDCGLPGYQIACDESSSLSGIILSGRRYQVKNLFLSERLITVIDMQLIKDLMAGSCTSLRNLTIMASGYIPPLSLPPWATNVSLLQCPGELKLPHEFLEKVVRNYTCRGGDALYLWQNGSQFDPPRLSPSLNMKGCSLIRIPVSMASYGFLIDRNRKHRIELVDVLADGFPLTWPNFEECNSCNATGGRCGFDGSLRRIVCLHDLSITKLCGIYAGVAAGCSATAIIVVALMRKRISTALIKTESQNTGEGINTKRFIRTYRSGLLTNYTHNDIKKMTKGFKEKLGEGGCGNVYKGNLSDGRLVAVKLLEKSNHIGHDFINEIATIGRIHHVNVISLLGFSWNGSRQALIYEYMPNGSLADLLSNEEFCLSLGMSRMLEIAIGIAHGIEYLHNGCESRILHLDIKPQNVLLDQNFNPKISDFGLAKIYSRSQSAVLMTNAKGTIGYIAPEIFMRNFGNASHKSDVYSFGMLLLEMFEGKNRIEPGTTTSSEAYFPSCIYKLVEQKNLESYEHEDANIVTKMVLVGLWCIQINPKERPSMTRVLEMLTGDADAIEVPPKPFLFSPPRLQHEIDIASIGESDISELDFASNSFEMENTSTDHASLGC
ncbi:hypothetical protein P3X46_031371 [Hevea brasiliensis]|uniref:non-specific serine/threonine protein kinase n=1 Tax=Hevea brasiliensis TaxID=3981 RepID=A0ABQ9KLM5_HEVBR|nr:hypothetical protein P3X46_031371 [Hevea brasiliensis]